MTITITTFTAKDRDDWLALWEAYLVFYKATLPPNVGHQTWERMIDPEGEIQGFKAVDANGVMVGMVTYLYHGTTWGPHPRCYLHDLYTLAETRGQGVGRALIEAVYEAAAADGSDQVYWLTQEFNYAGRMLYDKVAERTPFIKYAHKV
ncbi:GNAT family N-acetyltransferase [Pseudahrensia aquimaris]|uniref:GNAT family N-acetyltransferase n=1 Tax=Pseudahrensia aquimaris TaxID=744461 RepID=A0ABW3FJE8_9HYPH